MEDNQPESPSHGILDEQDDKIIIATFTCFTAFVLFVTFFILATRFRLWHTNWLLEKIPKMVDNPVTYLISICAGLYAEVSYGNDLYWIWLMVLIIAYDNVLTISAGSTPGSSWLLREYVNLFYCIYLGFFINQDVMVSHEYHVPLLVLWSLLLAKFSLRLVFHKLVKRAYGLNNSKVVSDFMKIEHELAKPNENVDPQSMKGYNYLVLGEGKINPTMKGPEYTAEIKLPADVVTLEKVWSCKERLLDPSMDTDNRLRDVCLSFAFFKLLKRRFFEYPAAEAQQEKTRQLVFDGLLKNLNKDNDSTRVYRVLAMEIGFIRDFFYTRYPIIFAFGFPVFQVILLTGMLGVSLWISAIAFHRREDSHNSYLKHNNHNIDYTITNILLIIMSVMEALETMTYVFSDWTKVMLICLCETHPVKDGGNTESIQPHYLVASQLSKYCAYLMVFLPDMLPDSIFSVKLFFREILSETKQFDGAHSLEDKYNLMMQNVGGHGNGVIDMGVRLGRYLMEIPDDVCRWKIMAEFWSEFIIFLAPWGKVREHMRMLESGGEFITHLWALLYHAGIVDHNTTASSGYIP
ncbi:hypothetical protein LUZ61_012892 [Rhynchospora tenuis]|uniref:DUF4220 domain-containing protein n=1 Tax=Rhynchospora tenuis TaxID=198213 RepID=A0AAD6A3S3_9POAL|nr:hypothetical protein LUZ61_012892 [Rhynchospora tenuis]